MLRSVDPRASMSRVTDSSSSIMATKTSMLGGAMVRLWTSDVMGVGVSRLIALLTHDDDALFSSFMLRYDNGTKISMNTTSIWHVLMI